MGLVTGFDLLMRVCAGLGSCMENGREDWFWYHHEPWIKIMVGTCWHLLGYCYGLCIRLASYFCAVMGSALA